MRNIPYDTSESEIQELFGRYGKINAIRLPVCREDPKKLKGICFVDFSDSKSLIEALELDGYSLRGRFLKLDADISYDESTNTKIKNKSTILQTNPNQLNFQAASFNINPPQKPNLNGNSSEEEVNKYKEYLYQTYLKNCQNNDTINMELQMLQNMGGNQNMPANQNMNDNQNMYCNNMYYPDMQNQMVQNLTPPGLNNCQSSEDYFRQENFEYNNIGDNQQNYNMQNYEHLHQNNACYDQQNYQYYNNFDHMNNYQNINAQNQNIGLENCGESYGENYGESYGENSYQGTNTVSTQRNTEAYELTEDVLEYELPSISSLDTNSVVPSLDCDGDIKKLVEPEMQREIEEFRKLKISDSNEKSVTNKVEETTVETAPTQKNAPLVSTIFGKAMLKTSTYVTKSHVGIDYVLNPLICADSSPKKKNISNLLPKNDKN